jgi:hypothetical protein
VVTPQFFGAPRRFEGTLKSLYESLHFVAIKRDYTALPHLPRFEVMEKRCANLNSAAMQEGYNAFQKIAAIHQYLVSPLRKFVVIPMVPYTGLNFAAQEERKEDYAAGLN